jgi:hypothetical protein
MDAFLTALYRNYFFAQDQLKEVELKMSLPTSKVAQFYYVDEKKAYSLFLGTMAALITDYTTKLKSGK